jgi:hypothetical protein
MTLPRTGSSSTTSPPLCVRVPRHVTRLVTQPVALLIVDYSTSRRLVVDYSASRRLIVDYFAYAARPGASARHTAHHAAHRATRHRLLRLVQARRRLIRLHRASRCLGTSRRSSHGWSRHSLSTIPRRAARCAARRATRRRLLRLAQARRRLLRLRRASSCLGTSRGSSRGLSRGSSSTTSPTPRIWVPRHVAPLITCR